MLGSRPRPGRRPGRSRAQRWLRSGGGGGRLSPGTLAMDPCGSRHPALEVEDTPRCARVRGSQDGGPRWLVSRSGRTHALSVSCVECVRFREEGASASNTDTGR